MNRALRRAFPRRPRPMGWRLALAGALAASAALPAYVAAKTPGATYCFLGTCHRVKTIEETRGLVGRTLTLHASYYDDPSRDSYNPSNLTSSGEYFRAGQPDNAASPVFPDGTKLLVWHPRSQRAIVVRVNNAGPYWGRRTLDLSRAGAERLGFRHSGVGTVLVKVLEAPTRAEASYRRGRKYAPVPGDIGSFASIDDALLDAGRRLALNFEGLRPVQLTDAILVPVPHETGDTVVATQVAAAELDAPTEMQTEALIAFALLVPPEPEPDPALTAALRIAALPHELGETLAAAAPAAPTTLAEPTEMQRETPVAHVLLAPASDPSHATAPVRAEAPAQSPQPLAVAQLDAARPIAAPTARIERPQPELSRSRDKPARASARRSRPSAGEEADTSSSKTARMAASTARPAPQPAAVKVPQEPELDRRAWFRTALSLN